MTPSKPSSLDGVDWLFELLNQAMTFFSQSEEHERVSESIAISHLLTVASCPDLQSIYEAARRIDRLYSVPYAFPLALETLTQLLRFVFDGGNSEGVRPGALATLDGRLTLRRHVGAYFVAGHVPTFDQLWSMWRGNPRRDLTPYLHEIMTAEEMRAKWRTDGAKRSPHRVRRDSHKVERLTSLLATVFAAYLRSAENQAIVSALLEVAREEETVAIGAAGTCLLAYHDAFGMMRTANAFLSLLPPLLFDRRLRASGNDFPLDPFVVLAGRIGLPVDFETRISDEEWEGTILVWSKLYARRDLSAISA